MQSGRVRAAMVMTCAPLCFDMEESLVCLQRLWYTECLGVVALAPVTGMDTGKRLCSCALALPRSRRRRPTKCRAHEDVVFCVIPAYMSRNAPLAVMEHGSSV